MLSKEFLIGVIFFLNFASDVTTKFVERAIPFMSYLIVGKGGVGMLGPKIKAAGT
jgi:hypothetical protein